MSVTEQASGATTLLHNTALTDFIQSRRLVDGWTSSSQATANSVNISNNTLYSRVERDKRIFFVVIKTAFAAIKF